MDVRLHQRAECGVYELVPLDTGPAGKGRRNDDDPEMPPPIARARMAGMQMALVVDLQQFRFEGLQQPLPDRCNPLFVHFVPPWLRPNRS